MHVLLQQELESSLPPSLSLMNLLFGFPLLSSLSLDLNGPYSFLRLGPSQPQPQPINENIDLRGLLGIAPNTATEVACPGDWVGAEGIRRICSFCTLGLQINPNPIKYNLMITQELVDSKIKTSKVVRGKGWS